MSADTAMVHIESNAFGTPLFTMKTQKGDSAVCGCCKSEYETEAKFYSSLLATSNRERHFACCCCETPWVENIAAWPKYKVLSVQFDDAISYPFFCNPGCPLPCCNSVVCGCCFAVRVPPDQSAP